MWYNRPPPSLHSWLAPERSVPPWWERGSTVVSVGFPQERNEAVCYLHDTCLRIDFCIRGSGSRNCLRYRTSCCVSTVPISIGLKSPRDGEAHYSTSVDVVYAVGPGTVVISGLGVTTMVDVENSVQTLVVPFSVVVYVIGQRDA